ncbi:MAG: SEC-C metal-binding domain-containing protein [Eubacteriales bacterium]|nr:SEC-C metal-binding domain-containing protein [Eubacteriales bacterium]
MKDKNIPAGESKLFNDTIVDYIISLTHLYGLVHKDKVVEIFNLQNKEKIDITILSDTMENPSEDLIKNFVEINGDYFVHETIMEFDNFDAQLKHWMGKPLYIPAREELLKYKEETYFEVTKEYQALLSYVTKNIFDGDEFAAEMLCEDVQGICQFDFSMQEIFEVFNSRGVDFNNERQVNEVVQLVMELANNTRIWENNGHTPNEIFEKHEKPHLRPLPNKPFEFDGADIFDFKTGKKVGRNDPCPCGSGKKYKKCCLGKE